MKRWLWIGFIAVLTAVLIVVWISLPQRLPEEREVVDLLRNTPMLTIKGVFRADESCPEPIVGDRGSLARAFRIAKNVGNYTGGTTSAIGVYDSEDADRALFYLYPDPFYRWTYVRYGNALYVIEDDFWTELLNHAPATKQWLQEKETDELDEARAARSFSNAAGKINTSIGPEGAEYVSPGPSVACDAPPWVKEAVQN